jgi:hypothetical protein
MNSQSSTEWQHSIDMFGPVVDCEVISRIFLIFFQIFYLVVFCFFYLGFLLYFFVQQNQMANEA